VLGKPWGDAVTLSFGDKYLTNGPGADLYITAKNVVGGIVQSTSTGDKSFAVALHIINGPNPGWHEYNASNLVGGGALPVNYEPAETGNHTPPIGNPLGAIDLSSLKLGAGTFNDGGPLAALTTFIPDGALIDYLVLINNNAANADSWGFLGTTAEAPTGFVARRDFDNADLDGNPYTGKDYLTGRYVTRYTNGQDGPQAWFVGLENTTLVPVHSVVGLMGMASAALLLGRRRR
jgi:hypothetical protein